MNEVFEHPDPDWTPIVRWGDSIPMKWVRVSEGLWFIWAPRQISTDEPGGLNTWRNDFRISSHYVPDRQTSCAPSNLSPPSHLTNDATVDWFGDHPASWGGYPDGRSMVILSDFMVTCSPSKVRFRQAYSYAGRDLGFYYATHVENPPTEPFSKWASGGFGPVSPPNASERLWYYPTPDGRRWVGTFDIEPEGLTFNRSAELPLPILPTDDEIEAERAKIDEEKQTHGDLWPLSQMQRDLAQSTELMNLVGQDSFAAEFQLFVRQGDFVHLKSGKLVRFTTDDNGAWMLSELRCYHEPWRECEMYPKEENPEVRETLVRLFAVAGYAPYEVAIDEQAYLANLQTIWETMPAKLKQEVVGEQDKVQALVLAWAIGEFWSQNDGWNLSLHNVDTEEIHLKGGHLPDAIRIAQLVEEGQLSGNIG